MEESVSLADLVAEVARERVLDVAHDTHYDANNWVLRWWEGSVLCEINIQPYPDGRVEVALLRTTYLFLPRLLAWARRTVPMFPQLAATQRTLLGSTRGPGPALQVRELIERGLPPNNSINRTPLRGAGYLKR